MNVATARISESTESIRVRVGAALFIISGGAREMLDAETVANEICGLDAEDAICALYGLGFQQRGMSAMTGAGYVRCPPSVIRHPL